MSWDTCVPNISSGVKNARNFESCNSTSTKSLFRCGPCVKDRSRTKLKSRTANFKEKGYLEHYIPKSCRVRMGNFSQVPSTRPESIERFFGIRFLHVRINGQQIRFLDHPEWSKNIVFVNKHRDVIAYARISRPVLQSSLSESQGCLFTI